MDSKFETYVGDPPQVQAIQITDDLRNRIAGSVMDNDASMFDEPLDSSLKVLSDLHFAISKHFENMLCLYGTRGIQEVHAGDYLVLHPDSRHYMLTPIQFHRTYRKQTPRVVTITNTAAAPQTITGMEH